MDYYGVGVGVVGFEIIGEVGGQGVVFDQFVEEKFGVNIGDDGFFCCEFVVIGECY